MTRGTRRVQHGHVDEVTARSWLPAQRETHDGRLGQLVACVSAGCLSTGVGLGVIVRSRGPNQPSGEHGPKRPSADMQTNFPITSASARIFSPHLAQRRQSHTRITTGTITHQHSYPSSSRQCRRQSLSSKLLVRPIRAAPARQLTEFNLNDDTIPRLRVANPARTRLNQLTIVRPAPQTTTIVSSTGPPHERRRHTQGST